MPTTLSPDLRSRPPHLRTWRDGWRHLRFLLLFSPRWLFFYPGLALMPIGLVAMIALLPGELRALRGRLRRPHAGLRERDDRRRLPGDAVRRLRPLLRDDSGFLPGKPWIADLNEKLSLEAGALVGLGLIVAGFAMSIVAIFVWGDSGFADLDYRETLRLVIPASTMLILGVQTVLASFFISILGIRARSRPRLIATKARHEGFGLNPAPSWKSPTESQKLQSPWMSFQENQ